MTVIENILRDLPFIVSDEDRPNLELLRNDLKDVSSTRKLCIKLVQYVVELMSRQKYLKEN